MSKIQHFAKADVVDASFHVDAEVTTMGRQRRLWDNRWRCALRLSQHGGETAKVDPGTPKFRSNHISTPRASRTK